MYVGNSRTIAAPTPTYAPSSESGHVRRLKRGEYQLPQNNGQQRSNRKGTSEMKPVPARKSQFVNSNYRDRSIWETRDVPVYIKSEWLSELNQVLSSLLAPRDTLRLLDYCLYWHPLCPTQLRDQFESERYRPIINTTQLAAALHEIGSQPDILRLLQDRGPDFGISLLVLLELLFQAAYCLKKPARQNQDCQPQAQSKKNLSSVVVNAPRLLELLSLHLDCPPLWPSFRTKFSMVLLGLMFHRKLPTASLPRFSQLLYILCPLARKLALMTTSTGPNDVARASSRDPKMLKRVDWNDNRPLHAKKKFLNVIDFESALWNKAQSLSLGQPKGTTSATIKKRGYPKTITTRLEAMATVFERLNHLALALFGTSLCLYGSSATGFATQVSDVDVVLRLSDEGVTKMLAEARSWRNRSDGVDLNCFPFMSLSGPSEMVGDWSWLDSKEPTVAASIWAGRKFAWSCFRLLGWRGQCVQSAYVPIVKIMACVDSKGSPVEVPNVFAPAAPVENSLPALLGRLPLDLFKKIGHLPRGSEETQGLSTFLDAMKVSGDFHHWTTAALTGKIARLVAADVIAERQYAAWVPSFSPRVDENLSAALLKHDAYVEEETSENEPSARGKNKIAGLKESQGLHLKLLWEYWMDENTKIQVNTSEADMEGSGTDGGSVDEGAHGNVRMNFSSCCRTSPTLLHPKPSTAIDDGRLSPLEATVDKELWLVESDVSMCRQVGIHNSRLLRAYGNCDPRALVLGLLIKNWAASNAIEGAYAGFLSGYQWTLLVIHFLQHYSCLKVPDSLKDTRVWADYVRAFESADLPPPTTLPILPNLQHEPVGTDSRETKPLYIHEIEGDVDVFFYEPHLGFNSLLKFESSKDSCDQAAGFDAGGPNAAGFKAAGPSTASAVRSIRKRQRPEDNAEGWPEDTLLKHNPFRYAYSLLSVPIALDPGSVNDYTVVAPPSAGCKYSPKRLEQNKTLWISRITTAPRPCTGLGPNESTLAPDIVWNLSQQKMKEALTKLSSQKEGGSAPCGRASCAQKDGLSCAQCVCGNLSLRDTFPPLTQLRDRQFLNDHLMDRSNLLVEIASDDVTMTELLYAFFEYYGLRFNFATEMLDIDRIPMMPEGKKEFFKTSLFSPIMFGSNSSNTHDRNQLEPSIDDQSDHQTVPGLVDEEGNPTQVQPVASTHPATIFNSDDPPDEEDPDLPSSDSAADEKEIADAPVEGGDFPNDAQIPIVTGAKADREVTGRGNGPFQYRGRHFMCLRDPFEKLRTIGPPHRCQTWISAAFLGALQFFKESVCIPQMNDHKCEKTVTEGNITRLFSWGGRSRTLNFPIREVLAHHIMNPFEIEGSVVDKFGIVYSKAHLFPVGGGIHQMYDENIALVHRFGRYQTLIDDVFLRRQPHMATVDGHMQSMSGFENDGRSKHYKDSGADKTRIFPANRRESQVSSDGSRGGKNIRLDGTHTRKGGPTRELESERDASFAFQDAHDIEGLVCGGDGKNSRVWKFKDYENPERWLETRTGVSRKFSSSDGNACSDKSGAAVPTERGGCIAQNVSGTSQPQVNNRNEEVDAQVDEQEGDFRQVDHGDLNSAESTVRSLRFHCRLEQRNQTLGQPGPYNVPPNNQSQQANQFNQFTTGMSTLSSTLSPDVKREHEKILLQIIQGSINPNSSDLGVQNDTNGLLHLTGGGHQVPREAVSRPGVGNNLGGTHQALIRRGRPGANSRYPSPPPQSDAYSSHDGADCQYPRNVPSNSRNLPPTSREDGHHPTHQSDASRLQGNRIPKTRKSRPLTEMGPMRRCK